MAVLTGQPLNDLRTGGDLILSQFSTMFITSHITKSKETPKQIISSLSEALGRFNFIRVYNYEFCMLEYFQKASRDVEGMKVGNAVVEEVDTGQLSNSRLGLGEGEG